MHDMYVIRNSEFTWCVNYQAPNRTKLAKDVIEYGMFMLQTEKINDKMNNMRHLQKG